MDENLEEIALDIVTDPKIAWQKITGKSGWLFERTKYIADGYRNGKKMRVVFEPEFAQPIGRGILCMLDLEAQSPEEISGDAKKVLNLLQKLSHYMQEEEISIVDYFLYREHHQLAFEILCDYLKDKEIRLLESDLNRIKELTEELHLNPNYTWELLIYIDSNTGEPRRALIDEEVWQIIEDDLNFILLSMKDKISLHNFQTVKEFIDVGEYTLATEDFIWSLIDDKIKIPRVALEKLKELRRGFSVKLTEEQQALMDQAVCDE